LVLPSGPESPGSPRAPVIPRPPWLAASFISGQACDVACRHIASFHCASEFDTARFNVVELLRKCSETLGRKGGGGRPEMAQAGGPDGAKANAALSAIEQAMAVACAMSSSFVATRRHPMRTPGRDNAVHRSIARSCCWQFDLRASIVAASQFRIGSSALMIWTLPVNAGDPRFGQPESRHVCYGFQRNTPPAHLQFC
jgi:DHHA1 domain